MATPSLRSASACSQPPELSRVQVRDVPKALVVVLVVAGGCHLVDVVARFLVPDFAANIHNSAAVIPIAFVEVRMVLYLFVKGVRVLSQGTPSARAAATSVEAAARVPSRREPDPILYDD